MNTAAPLPQYVHDFLSSPPRRGDGLNVWFFRVARVLHAFRSESEIIELLRAATAGEAIAQGEIERAVARSKTCAWHPGETTTSKPQSAWPKVNVEQREAVIAQAGGFSVVDLWESSPVRLETSDSYTDDIVTQIFPGNPLLCCGKSTYEFATRPLSKWHGRLAELQLIVPSPMTAQTGLTQDGKQSEHTLANTGPRRFLVIEQDQGTSDEQAAVLHYLSRRLPLVLAVHSGGKSLHGWFFCEGRDEDWLRDQMCAAVTLGADPATWTRSQFVRMPDGTRDNGARQPILYFNPADMSRLRRRL